MRSFLILIIVFFNLISFSQNNGCLHEECIYNNLLIERYKDSIEKTLELEHLKSILYSDSDSVSYLIGKMYYDDFLLPNMMIDPPNSVHPNCPDLDIYDSIAYELFMKCFKNSFFKNSADSALFYFKKIKELYPVREKALFFVTNQLECYVNKDSSKVNLDTLVSSDDYIPYWYFANISKNWKSDISKDYLDLIISYGNFYPFNDFDLPLLKEEPLYNKIINKDHEIFRMTYNPSFHDNICIRVEKVSGKVILHWKKSDKVKGCNKGIKSKGQTALSTETWNYFMSLVKEFDFNEIPNRYIANLSYNAMRVSSFDGASWFYEYKSSDYYKAHLTKRPSRELEVLALYLLELSGVSYKTDKWDIGYFKNDLILTDDLKYVIPKDIEDTIISCLNDYIDLSIENNECCCYFDSNLKFSKKGKIKIVRKPWEDYNAFLNLWWMYSERKCRNMMEKALKNLDLSYLKLSKPLYYYLELCYDKEEHKFREQINNCH